MNDIEALNVVREPNPNLSEPLWHTDLSPLIGQTVKITMVGGHEVEGVVTEINEKLFPIEIGKGKLALRWPYSIVLDGDRYMYYAFNTLEKISVVKRVA
jgi:hypothetical protein